MSKNINGYPDYPYPVASKVWLVEPAEGPDHSGRNLEDYEPPPSHEGLAEDQARRLEWLANRSDNPTDVGALLAGVSAIRKLRIAVSVIDPVNDPRNTDWD